MEPDEKEIPFDKDTDHQWLEEIKSEILTEVEMWPPGTQLKFNFLKSIDADPNLMEKWILGWPLDPDDRTSQEMKNHRSLDENSDRVHKEYVRLRKKGKVTLFPKGQRKPDRLHVSPCAAVITEKTIDTKNRSWEDIPIEEKTKLRIVLDLLRGRVNERLTAMEVDFTCSERAAKLMSKDCWIWTIDLTDAFLNWKVKEEGTWLLGFYSPGNDQYGKHEYAMIGLSNAPAINERRTNGIMRLCEKQERIQTETFVDDIIGAAATWQLAWLEFRQVIRFLLRCGIPISTTMSGRRPPRQIQVWIDGNSTP